MITREEYLALASETMTQGRYEALCAHYNIEATSKIAGYMDGDYDYATYGQTPEYRIRQLRAHRRYQERLAAQTPQDLERQRQREIQALRDHEKALRDEAEADRYA